MSYVKRVTRTVIKLVEENNEHNTTSSYQSHLSRKSCRYPPFNRKRHSLAIIPTKVAYRVDILRALLIAMTSARPLLDCVG